jgi:hypothetical protein
MFALAHCLPIGWQLVVTVVIAFSCGFPGFERWTCSAHNGCIDVESAANLMMAIVAILFPPPAFEFDYN